MKRKWIIAVLLSLTIFTISCEAPPDLSAEDYYQLGLSLAAQGKYEEAINAFTNAIVIDPGKTEYYVNRGDTYQNTRDYGLAIADYNKALELEPNDAMTSYKLLLAKQAKEIQDAADELQEGFIEQNETWETPIIPDE